MGNTCCTKDSPKEKRRNKVLKLPRVWGKKTTAPKYDEIDAVQGKEESFHLSRRSSKNSSLLLSGKQMFTEELE